ncbi:hypothetical protein JKP88DRAFT_171204, partial [Tribonema minus]
MDVIPPQLPPRTLRESVNEAVLRDLLERGQDVLRAIAAKSPNPKHQNRDLVGILKKYRARKQHQDRSRSVKYSFAAERSERRLSVDGIVTMQGIDRPVRHSMGYGEYGDLVDQINAHPTICSQALHKLGRECPFLDLYVAERETWLQAITAECGIDRDGAKGVMLRAMYGGNP